MTNQIVRDQVENKIRLINGVDETIESVCRRVKDNDFCPEEYAEAVKALAILVAARALL